MTGTVCLRRRAKRSWWAATPVARADRSGSGHGSRLIARRALFERLSAGGPAGVTLVSAPPGSGKTVLLRSWIEDSGLADRVAWVTVERGEQDPQRFWLSVVGELRAAVGANAFVEKLTPSPDFDGEAVVDRLVSELGSLEDPVVLVIDDLHELSSPRGARPARDPARPPASSAPGRARHPPRPTTWAPSSTSYRGTDRDPGLRSAFHARGDAGAARRGGNRAVRRRPSPCFTRGRKAGRRG